MFKGFEIFNGHSRVEVCNRSKGEKNIEDWIRLIKKEKNSIGSAESITNAFKDDYSLTSIEKVLKANFTDSRL